MTRASVQDIQRVADLVMLAQDAASVAGTIVRTNPEIALAKAEQAGLCCRNALARLEVMGAVMRGPGETAADAVDVPLHLLDTPAVRALLEGLQALGELAAAVDQERGYVDPDGEPIGWAETIGGLAVQLQLEVEGPKGRD